MNCDTARELLLVADPADLDGRTESELSRHLRDCEACRRAADLVLHALAELEVGLASNPDTSAVATARRAIAEARKRRVRSQWVRRAVPLAAAAGLAALLIVRRSPRLPPDTVPPRAPIHDVTVTAPPGGQSLAVLHTADPNIVVVWFF
jgi:predicted anti-sigma-YlaC factor YlaD